MATAAGGSSAWPRWAIAGYVLLYTAAQVAFAIRVSFHVAVNDALGLVLISDAVDWARPETLHNGFFPFALPALLSALPAGTTLPVAGMLSAGMGAVALVATYVVAARLAGAWWGFAAAVVLSLNPHIVAYFASPGPDVIAMALAMVGVALYVSESDRLPSEARLGLVFASGLLFGFAGLFRYHAALIGLGLLTWAALRHSRAGAYLAAAALGIVLGFLPQVVINVLGGFGPLESDSAFTIYQSVVPIDWRATSAIDPDAYASVLGVVTTYPFEFATSYLQSWGKFLTPIAVLAVAVVVHRPRRSRTVVFSLLVAAVGFAAVVSTGNSPRGLIPVLPLAAVGLAIIASRAFEASAGHAPAWQRGSAIAVVLAGLVVLPNLAEDAAVVQGRRAAEQVRESVESAVVASGVVDDARQILTNDFDLYLTELPGINPDKIGGWYNISLSGREPHTDVDLGSVTGFYCDARDRGIRMVLWSPGSVPGMDPDLEAALTGTWRTPLLRSAGTNGWVPRDGAA